MRGGGGRQVCQEGERDEEEGRKEKTHELREIKLDHPVFVLETQLALFVVREHAEEEEPLACAAEELF